MVRLLIILILLISCTDEDMRLFQSNLPNSGFPSNGVRVYLLTGQSNAGGRGLNSEATSGELEPQPQFKIWSKINSQFENLDIPANNLSINSTFHGIELGLALNFNTYYPGETGYLIKWGVDSTEIVQHLSGGTVYEEFWNNYVKPALNDLINQGKIPFVYFIYIQGERDSNLVFDPNGPALYPARFDTLVSLWRNNIGVGLPIAPYEIHTPLPGSYDQTRAINIVFENKSLIDNNLQVLETEFLSAEADNLHFKYSAHKAGSILAFDYFITKQGQPVTTLIP